MRDERNRGRPNRVGRVRCWTVVFMLAVSSNSVSANSMLIIKFCSILVRASEAAQ